MPAYMIAYDLSNKPEANYESITERIRNLFAIRCHLQYSVWLVRSNRSSEQVYDLLRPEMDDDDDLFVVDLGDDWVASASPSVIKWLDRHL